MTAPHRHRWVPTEEPADWQETGAIPSWVWRCKTCHRERDFTAHRRGTSARRLGADQERRIERVYGPRKIGEYGDPVDHIGRLGKWQSKASRSLPPRWLAAISLPTYRPILPASILSPLAAMAGLYGDREPIVIRSYVRQGIAVRDWIFVTAAMWNRERGHNEPFGYVVIPGSSWLDLVGRDSE